MDQNSSSKPKALIPPLVLAILVGGLVMAKPWLVDHLGVNLLSVRSRLIMALAAAVVCGICIVIVKVLNRPKTDA